MCSPALYPTRAVGHPLCDVPSRIQGRNGVLSHQIGSHHGTSQRASYYAYIRVQPARAHYVLYVYMYMYTYVNIYVCMNDRTKVRFLYDPNCRLPSACSTFDQQKKKSETNETPFRPLGYRARSQNYIPLGDHTRYLGIYEYVVTYVRIRIYKYSPLTKLILYFSSFAHRFRPLHTRHTRTHSIALVYTMYVYIHYSLSPSFVALHFFFLLILGPYLFSGLCSYFFFFLFSSCPHHPFIGRICVHA